MTEQTSVQPDDPPKTGARRHVWRTAAAIAAALAIGVVAIEAMEWRYLRQPLQAALQRATGMPIRFEGEFRAHLLRSPMMSMQRLTLASPSFPGLEHLVDATDVRLHWRWLDLVRAAFGAPLQLQSLQVATLDAQLIRDVAGHTSWQVPGSRQGGGLPRIGLLAVEQGHIRWTDAPLATHIDLVVQGAEGGSAVGYNVKATGLVRSLPLDLDIAVGGMLALLRDEADALAATPMRLRIDGKAGRSTLHFDGTATALLDAQRLSGEFRFAGPSLAAVGDPLGLVLPRTPAFELAGQIAHDAGVWTLVAQRMLIGKSQLAGNFGFDTRDTLGRLSGQLRGRLLQLSDLGPAVGTAGEGGSTGVLKPAAGARLLPTREFDLPSLREMNADIAVDIDTLDLGSKDIAPMRQLRAQLTLQGGRLKLENLHADVAGGHMKGTTVLDGSTDVANWQADLRLDGIDVARWLRSLHEGDDASAPAYLTGELIARLKATGSGRSTAQILGSLDGQALLRLRKGTLSHLAVEAAGLDLAQALGVMVRGDRPLPMNCAVIAMELSDGVMTARRAVIDTSDSTLLMNGSLNLNDEVLDLRVMVKPKDFSLMSLRAPVTVTGTLVQPVVGIQAEALAGRAVAAALLAVLAPPAALLAFMDFGEPENADPCLRDLR